MEKLAVFHFGFNNEEEDVACRPEGHFKFYTALKSNVTRRPASAFIPIQVDGNFIEVLPAIVTHM